MIHSRMYTGTASPPVTIVAATHNRRTSAGSISKYSARPPATPAHIRSRVLRMSRRGAGGSGTYGGDGGWGGDAGGVGGYSAMSVPPVVQRYVALWTQRLPGVQYRLVF